MGKKSKKDKDNQNKIKKINELKDNSERVLEVNDLKNKIENLGLNENFEGMELFYNILDQYVIDGLNQEGQIKLPGVKRIIEYNLYNKKNQKISVNLKYSDQV